MENICRVCLSGHDELVNIFDEKPGPGPSIPDLIAQWSEYPVFKGDFLPEHICPTCLEDAKNEYKVPKTLKSPKIEPADFDDTEGVGDIFQTYCPSQQTKKALGDHIDSNSNNMKDTRLDPSVKPHKCNDCSKLFRFKNQLTKHIQTHTGERPHQCPLCYWAFKQKHHLVRHMIVHTRYGPYKCFICQRSFKKQSLLRTHNSIHY